MITLRGYTEADAIMPRRIEQLAQEVRVLAIERIAVADEVVEEEEDAVSLLLGVRHNLPNDRVVPFIVHVRLGKVETFETIVESQRATEDEDVLTEVLFVAVLGQGYHVLNHVRLTAVTSTADNHTERRLGHELVRDGGRVGSFLV